MKRGVLVYFAVLRLVQASQQGPGTGFFIEKLNCSYTTSLCKDPICDLKSAADNPQAYTITVGCNLTKSVPKLGVQLRTSLWNGKQYVLTPVANVEFDICQINKVGINPIVTTFVPNMAQQIDRIFHACPYEDKLLLDRLEIEGSKMPIIFKNREIKQEIVFVRGKHQPIFTMLLFCRTGN